MDEQTVTDSPEARLSSFFNPETEAVPQAEPEAQAPEPEQVADTEEQAEEPQEAQAYEEFEADGNVYQLPPELAKQVKEWREGFQRRDDYTRKTQETAAIARQLAAVAETAQANETFERELAPQREELAYLNRQLAEYKKVDWMSLDAGQHMAMRLQMDRLKDRQEELNGEISQKQQHLQGLRAQKRQEVIQEGIKYLNQTVKGWNQKANDEATEVAREVGYSQNEVDGILDARFVRVLWEAAQYRKGQAKKPDALAAVQKAPPVVKPGAISNPAVSRNKALAQAHKKSGSVQTAAALLKQLMR